MRRCLSVLMLVQLSAVFALARPADVSPIAVKATHQKAHRHHAHKAGKHHRVKRAHYA